MTADYDKAVFKPNGTIEFAAMDGSNLYTVADYTSDALGRTTALSEGGYSRSATYNAKSQLTQDVVTTLRSDGTYVATTSYYYNASETASGTGLWDGVASGGSYMGGAVTRTARLNTKNGVDGDAADTGMVYRIR